MPDPLNDAAAARNDRAFALRPDEYVPDGIRRIARGQLEESHDTLARAPARTPGDAVHATRKSLKRLRAAVRLTRGALGEDAYARENRAFRDAARRLAAGRDAEVLVATLDGLCARFRDELPRPAVAALRSRLAREHEQAQAALRDDDGQIAEVRRDLERARARTTGWTLDGDGFDALAPGLQRIYRRGRRSMRAARKDPSDENLHEWRKRVKDLWHAAQIVRCAHPKRMRRVAKRAHALADVLGEAHDLAVLRGYAERHPECFEDEASAGALVDVVERRIGVLRAEALERGRRLYKRSPRRFTTKVARGWRKRAPSHAPPVAP